MHLDKDGQALLREILAPKKLSMVDRIVQLYWGSDEDQIQNGFSVVMERMHPRYHQLLENCGMEYDALVLACLRETRNVLVRALKKELRRKPDDSRIHNSGLRLIQGGSNSPAAHTPESTLSPKPSGKTRPIKGKTQSKGIQNG